MKETGILNRKLSELLAAQGHQDQMMVCDAGFAIPDSILSSLAQIEAELISERTKEALSERKRRGVQLGRRKGQIVEKKLGGKIDERRGYMAIDKTKTWIADQLGVTRATLYNFFK